MSGKFQMSDSLSFLMDWKYELGAEILVPRGRQELFESGVLHYYQYAQLYNPNSKIIVRTTTQDRMLKVRRATKNYMSLLTVCRVQSILWLVSLASSGQIMLPSRS